MIKSRRKVLRFGLMMLVALCFIAMFTLSSFKSVTVKAESDVETILVGDVIEAKNFEISHGGSKVKAENMTIAYPDGGVYVSDSFEVQQAGIYQITYQATVNDQKVEQTQKYKALRRPQDMIIGSEGMKIDYGKFFVPHETLKVQKDVKGALVNFRSGQSIEFVTNIPTAKLTAGFNIFDLIVMPSVYGETDFERLTVRVTDADDATNFIEIIIDSSNTEDGNGQTSYVKAGANGQQPGGYEGSTYHTSNYGTAIEHSFRGLARKYSSREEVIISEHSITVSIDNDSRQVYCGPATNTDKSNLFVNDLDDSTHYKSNPWGGFTSDEVSVKITAGKFSKVEGVVLVKSFAGFNLSKNIDDTVAPTISVDYDINGVLPTAVVGKDFPLFSYEAKDLLDKTLNFNVWVYYIDGSNKITIPNDGKTFNAKYEGDYVIVYSAEDLSGNETKQEIEITAVKTAPNIFVAIEDSLQEYDVYSTVTIAQDFEVKAYGGSGDLSIERTVYDPQKNVLTVKDRLTLEKLGDYKVVYKVTDYLGNVEYKVVTLRSKGTLAPVFVEEPRFESQFVKGFVYELENPLVVDSADGVLKEVECEIYVNGVLTEGSFTADGELVTIRYVAKGSNGQETTREIEVGVVDTEYGKYKSRYFYTQDEMQIIDELTHVSIGFESDSKVEFINALSTSELKLSLSYEIASMNFKTMKVVITDGANANLKVTVTFSFDKDSNKWYMNLNGNSVQIPFATTDNLFSLAYDEATKAIKDASGVEAGSISKWDDGDDFIGFSESVYVSFEFGAVSAPSAIFIDQICNQSMGYNKESIDDAFDEIEPVIVFDEVFVNRQQLGAKAKIPTARAFDVLGQITTFTVTVRLNSEVVATGSATEPIDLMLDKAGSYQVLYYAEDTLGNFKQIPYVIIVNDETAPTLTVKGKVKSEYKLGAKVKLPKYSATDNGENCYIQVCVILPNNEMRLLHYVENGELTSLLSFENKLYESAFKANDNAFYANSTGLYIIRILAYDEYYNVTLKEFEFIVK